MTGSPAPARFVPRCGAAPQPGACYPVVAVTCLGSPHAYDQ
jgi:hypothetical protein